MNSNKNKEKAKWTVLLFIAVTLFLIGLSTGLIYLNIGSIIIAFFIYKKGNAVLFKEYDERRKEKYEKAMVVREATKKAILTKKIFNKNNITNGDGE